MLDELTFLVGNSGVHAKGTVSITEILRSVKENPDFDKAGALSMFIGIVRGETATGEKVTKLELEAYKEQADEIINCICQDLKNEEGIIDVQIHHLLGDFAVGEDLVYVLVAGTHRHNVFPVLQHAVERYKKEAPIFKKEYVIDDTGTTTSYWVDEHEVT